MDRPNRTVTPAFLNLQAIAHEDMQRIEEHLHVGPRESNHDIYVYLYYSGGS